MDSNTSKSQKTIKNDKSKKNINKSTSEKNAENNQLQKQQTQEPKPKHDYYRNSPVIGKGAETYIDENDKQEFVRKTLTNTLHYWRYPIVKNDEEAIERLEEFFQRCIDNEVRPTVEGMAIALGTVRQTLYDYEYGKNKTVSSYIIKKAKEYIAEFDAQAVAQGKLNPVGYIFRSKNYYGLKDTQEHVIAPQLKDELSPTELEERARLLQNNEILAEMADNGNDDK